MRNRFTGRAALAAALGAGLTIAPFAVPLAGSSAAVAAEPPAIVINEVIQNNSAVADAIELVNAGSTPVDLSDWILADDKNELRIDAGTVIQPGEYLAITTDDDARADKFGLGRADQANVKLPDGTVVDHFAWSDHQSTSYGRCPDITGDFGPTVAATPGAANACTAAATGSIVVNEIESSADGDDWVELRNNGAQTIDLGGLILTDSEPAKHSWPLPTGTSLAPGAYLVLTESQFGFGLGKADAVTLLDGDSVVDSYGWEAHAEVTLGRCPDGVGAFAQTTAATPGGVNACAAIATPSIVVNEVETNQGDPGDWIEFVNLEPSDVDLSGWIVRDSDDAHVSVLPAGSTIPAGGFFVVEEAQLGFGLGKADSARLYLADGATLVDAYSWVAVPGDQHAPTTFGRCPDGTGEWSITTASTKGAANDCGLPIRINEVESNGDAEGDWVELVNVGASAVDLSGATLGDTSGTGPVTLPAGTELAAGGYLRVYVHETFGLGGEDAVTLAAADATVLDTVAWNSHAATTLGRCPDGTGDFVETREATPGAANACAGDLITSPWPGSDGMTGIDTAEAFGADMSGVVYDAAGTVWAVNNGTGTLHRLLVGGSPLALVEEARWTLRYPDGTGTVDAEGVALIGGDAANGVLVGSERNTGGTDRGSRPSVLRYALGGGAEGAARAGNIVGELVAEREWNLRDFYPGIGANAGIEGIAWISDETLRAAGLVDENTGLAYDPAAYPAHGGGLVFVGVEATSRVAGYVLGDAGEIVRVTEFDTAFPGVMELEYDTATGLLWVVCDEACEGRSQVFSIGAEGLFSAEALYERPKGTENYANEGFAIAPITQCTSGERPVIWADDGESDGHAFRIGTIGCAADGGPGGESGEGGSGSGTGAQLGEPEGTGAKRLSATGSEDPALAVAALAGMLMVGGAGALLARRRRV